MAIVEDWDAAAPAAEAAEFWDEETVDAAAPIPAAANDDVADSARDEDRFEQAKGAETAFAGEDLAGEDLVAGDTDRVEADAATDEAQPRLGENADFEKAIGELAALARHRSDDHADHGSEARPQESAAEAPADLNLDGYTVHGPGWDDRPRLTWRAVPAADGLYRVETDYGGVSRHTSAPMPAKDVHQYIATRAGNVSSSYETLFALATRGIDTGIRPAAFRASTRPWVAPVRPAVTLAKPVEAEPMPAPATLAPATPPPAVAEATVTMEKPAEPVIAEAAKPVTNAAAAASAAEPTAEAKPAEKKQLIAAQFPEAIQEQLARIRARAAAFTAATGRAPAKPVRLPEIPQANVPLADPAPATNAAPPAPPAEPPAKTPRISIPSLLPLAATPATPTAPLPATPAASAAQAPAQPVAGSQRIVMSLNMGKPAATAPTAPPKVVAPQTPVAVTPPAPAAAKPVQLSARLQAIVRARPLLGEPKNAAKG